MSTIKTTLASERKERRKPRNQIKPTEAKYKKERPKREKETIRLQQRATPSLPANRPLPSHSKSKCFPCGISIFLSIHQDILQQEAKRQRNPQRGQHPTYPETILTHKTTPPPHYPVLLINTKSDSHSSASTYSAPPNPTHTGNKPRAARPRRAPGGDRPTSLASRPRTRRPVQ